MYLRRTAVEKMTGLSRSTIYKLMAKGDFPRPVKLTEKAVGWPESVVAAWLAARPPVTDAAYAA
ncbi:AlpA family transcriptional regulator [Pseudomonas sp. GX19020]|uniref:helix-turn-helix transcriptional regulator n=1 Tax=Pseudomonas sp. GX19020 TaxID=2942277 RepID=UPI00201851A3|nr:AlpA family transcriptional regulator [Pseudomonas sp. GX19020]MCL4068337.1 AlpA family transcriptional regulator [Pseudomonas sp. GX19020]